MAALACEVSASNRVIGRELEREESFFFFFALVPTFSTNSRGIAGLRLHDLKLLVLEISHFILVLYGELQDTIVVSKLNKPPLSNKSPVSIKPPLPP